MIDPAKAHYNKCTRVIPPVHVPPKPPVHPLVGIFLEAHVVRLSCEEYCNAVWGDRKTTNQTAIRNLRTCTLACNFMRTYEVWKDSK